MPISAKRPCAAPGCTELVAAGRCLAHSRQREADRGTAAQRGYNYRWQQARIAFLTEHPLCADPFGVHGVSFVAARHVDHIRPHRGDPRLFWDPANWQALCASCHSRKTLEEIR